MVGKFKNINTITCPAQKYEVNIYIFNVFLGLAAKTGWGSLSMNTIGRLLPQRKEFDLLFILKEGLIKTLKYVSTLLSTPLIYILFTVRTKRSWSYLVQ